MDSYEQKIKEAEYHFRQMCEGTEGPRDEYLYKLRAFLSSSRSVLQYGLTESKRAGRQKEYIALLDQHPVIAFFKDTRDMDVHEKPVEARAHVSMFVADLVQATNSVEPLDGDDNRWMDPNFEPEQPETEFLCTIETSNTEYSFYDWHGTENATALCDIYLLRIKQIINSARSAGYIGFDT